jgi:hypothetical protein
MRAQALRSFSRELDANLGTEVLDQRGTSHS